ncbi:protein kinase domain protein [Ichthyophthirius multifiliis]|uniref:non-specific serine/threonine protein kinase n=1 Tax=Ichthyophthirius multifiliis TaxID=5932 RepID=G0R3Y2_ICHMU|nr:protein kinase domain protein [Ichthyophthirius multifiliis]EGR27813.1 protein kinase domain protein [Ichthyophthirius multifiliis]|eukprot:XP_004027158.1 protein kinase domain protein [Ichthyophthirius multifiliis]
MLEKQHQKNITIEDFTLINMIGEGAFAKVYLVRKKDNQKIYALKILKKKHIEQKNITNRVILEKDILSSIPPHPFIIKLHYSFQNQTKLFFVLEFCQGGELFNILSCKQKFDEEQARFYAAQIILALEHLHNNNIIYRDLKPENVILDRDGYIRISDFGLSKDKIDQEKFTYSLCGTPEYLAPEILKKQGHGKPVDWWTLGNLIYEMVTGNPPFYMTNENNTDELYQKILTQNIQLPSSLSKHCKDLLNRLFEKNPFVRLGINGAEEIKDHPWFMDVEWDVIYNKQYAAPFIPKVKNDIDVSNFSDNYVRQGIIDSYNDGDIYKEFPNFSFANSRSMLSQNNMDLE